MKEEVLELVDFTATAAAGRSVTVTPQSWVGSASGPSTARSFEIDWGDGAVTSVDLPASLSRSHTYAASFANTAALL